MLPTILTESRDTAYIIVQYLGYDDEHAKLVAHTPQMVRGLYSMHLAMYQLGVQWLYKDEHTPITPNSEEEGSYLSHNQRVLHLTTLPRATAQSFESIVWAIADLLGSDWLLRVSTLILNGNFIGVQPIFKNLASLYLIGSNFGQFQMFDLPRNVTHLDLSGIRSFRAETLDVFQMNRGAVPMPLLKTIQLPMCHGCWHAEDTKRVRGVVFPFQNSTVPALTTIEIAGDYDDSWYTLTKNKDEYWKRIVATSKLFDHIRFRFIQSQIRTFVRLGALCIVSIPLKPCL